MATGAVFQLITNDGKQDRMLMATALLNKRLQLVEMARARDPSVMDPTPTLLDIEKTHILFTNAHFKPFAAIGFEYNKVRASIGSNTLGGNLQFSIPQFGDFFNDMAVYVRLTVDNALITRTDDPTDTTSAARANAPAVRWCSYPGERLFKNVSFEVNGNPLDSYDRVVYNFYREFCVTPEKKVGWDRCMGQESCDKGFLRQPGVDRTATAITDSGVAGGFQGVTSHRVCMDVAQGHQTPKLNAQDLELMIPLLFWFNLDPRLSVPSVAIPFGMRYISMNLAQQSELLGLVPRGTGTWDVPRGSIPSNTVTVAEVRLYINNIFVNPEVHDIFIRRIGFTLIRVHRLQVKDINKTADDLQLNNFKWPIETMYVGMKVKEYEDNVANSMHLDRWHAFSQRTVSAENLENLVSTANMTELTGTVELLGGAGAVVGVGTSFTTEVAQGDLIQIVHLPGALAGTDAPSHLGVVTAIGGDLAMTLDPPLPAGFATGLPAGSSAYVISQPVTEVETCTKTIDTLSILAHGIPLYNEFESLFYNAYQPLMFGGHNIQTPSDCGAMMINFGLYPRTYQPSSHINVSRAREFFIKWSSSVIDSATLGTLYSLGVALNFLLISDGSAVLRYST